MGNVISRGARKARDDPSSPESRAVQASNTLMQSTPKRKVSPTAPTSASKRLLPDSAQAPIPPAPSQVAANQERIASSLDSPSAFHEDTSPNHGEPHGDLAQLGLAKARDLPVQVESPNKAHAFEIKRHEELELHRAKEVCEGSESTAEKIREMLRHWPSKSQMGPIPQQLISKMEGSIFFQRGSMYQAMVLAALRNTPYTIRSMEFAALSGVILSKGDEKLVSSSQNWADRLFQISGSASTPKMFGFQIKSAMADAQQSFTTSPEQMNAASVFILIEAKNTAFVAVVPNRFVRKLKSASSLITNATTHSPRYTFCLDLGLAKHMVPLHALPSAIAAIQKSFDEDVDYINPYTGVKYTDWRPRKLNNSDSLLVPSNDQRRRSYETTRRIHRVLRDSGSEVSCDIVYHAPTLGDFRLDHHDLHFLVELKEITIPSEQNVEPVLKRLPVARGDKYYFTQASSFDIIMYYVHVSAVNKPDILFMIPEADIPNAFFTGTTKTQDFTSLAKFRFLVRTDSDLKDTIEKTVSSLSSTQPTRSFRPARQILTKLDSTKPAPKSRSASKPTQDENFHRCLYEGIMGVCCQKKFGAIVPLHKKSVAGDFLFVPHVWAAADCEAWSNSDSRAAPLFMEGLSGAVTAISIRAVTMSHMPAVSDSFGDTLFPQSILQSIHHSATKSMVVVDSFGPKDLFDEQDMREQCSGICVVPSDEIVNKVRKSQQTLSLPSPKLQDVVYDYLDCFSTGSIATVFRGCDWDEVWQGLKDALEGKQECAFFSPWQPYTDHRCTMQQVYQADYEAETKDWAPL